MNAAPLLSVDRADHATGRRGHLVTGRPAEGRRPRIGGWAVALRGLPLPHHDAPPGGHGPRP
ncbi:hypothetical protein GCM10010275_53230 [Streptomyces litmocidini]|uniref:hypothetical protein n=1 Tax=Streptomyces litmocidini TaxID=67318 RepID=UPI00167CCDE7|nr:hypothetical protein [Streptomyces litmocidini]GGV06545.1 hypothetical protein GCM10010275_53230 [Streptomyces litmocidini]